MKNEKFEELITPCSVFMTFENEEGVNRALEAPETIANSDGKYDHLSKWIETHEIEI